MATVTNIQFDYLLTLAIEAVQNGLDRSGIIPAEVYQWIDDDTLQDAWDALTYKEQNAVCYDLRDQVHDAFALYHEFLKSDEYNELQYA